MPWSRIKNQFTLLLLVRSRLSDCEISRQKGFPGGSFETFNDPLTQARLFSSKRRVEGQRPDFLEHVIDLVFQLSESLEQSLIDSLIDSMPSGPQAIVDGNGGQIAY
jgi:hypothetical protein